MKKCPHCAEDIQDAALVCRYCQRAVVTRGAPPAVDEHARNRTRLIIVGVVLVVMFVAFLGVIFVWAFYRGVLR